jgi:uncharacterized secreted protein with C-terminal beta-propeller domain
MYERHRPQPRRKRANVLAATATTGALLAAMVASSPVGATPAKQKPKAANFAFTRFSSCDAFLKYVRPIALEQVGPYGFGYPYPVAVEGQSTGAPPTFPAAAQPAPVASPEAAADSKAAGGTSTTNTQEVGVDEGDIVETDGRVVYAAIGRKVFVTDALAGKLISSIDVPNNSGATQLILDGRRLAIITSAYSGVGPESVVTVVDVSNPAAPVKLNTTHLEGQALAVRSVDHRARLILTTSFGQRVAQKFPQPGPLNTDSEIKKATEANKKIVRSAPANDWLPRSYSEQANGSQTPVVQALSCGEVGRPRDGAGLGLTWIATIDLDTPNARAAANGSAGVVAQGGIVYASSDTIYVATQKYIRQKQGAQPTRATSTEVHAFDMRPADGAAWLASGSFTGSPLNQFSMSEFEGTLRIATTRFDAGFGGDSTSGVQMMRLDATDRRKLIVIGELWGLGTTERVYSVRFVDNQAYVVTFRQTDPLYVLDLADIRAPKKVGELKIPGYSSYLHSIGGGLLIGVGQNASDQGRITGSQASLFDVSNPAAPTRLATLDLGSSSGAEYDPHAFLWWPETRDLILPTVTAPYGRQGQRQPSPWSGAIIARVGVKGAATFDKRGQVSHDAKLPGYQSVPPTTRPQPATGDPVASPPVYINPIDPILRSLIVSGRLVTVSSQGVMTSDLATLGEVSWVKFDGQ